MSTQFPDDDPLATRLRDALSSEADMVQTSNDGLQRIRDRVDTTHRPWYLHPGVLAVAAAVVLGAAVGVGFAVLGDDGGKNVVASEPSDTASATTTPSDSPTPTPSQSSSSPEPGQTENVYVYYAMNDGGTPRLYREVHSVTSAGAESPVVPALADMLSRAAADPDYASLWPKSTTVRNIEVTGDVATVDLSNFTFVPAEAEKVAVQQLVYTVTANDKRVKKVRLLVKGEAPSSEHQDLSQPIARAPMLDVQGMIWLLAPTQGATVSSPVQIDGYGTAFEATINWEVYADGGKGPKVAEGHTMGGANGEFGEFHDTVDLPAGSYELRALEFSPKDGSPTHVDTKVFTVK